MIRCEHIGERQCRHKATYAVHPFNPYSSAPPWKVCTFHFNRWLRDGGRKSQAQALS